MELNPQQITQILILLFLSITFLISGYEKVMDWKGSVAYITEHFKLSPLKKYVSLLLMILVVMDFIAGILMFVGIFNIALTNDVKMALYGVQISSLAIIFMLIGQRLAKDYQGAMLLGVYFLICICGMYLLG